MKNALLMSNLIEAVRACSAVNIEPLSFTVKSPHRLVVECDTTDEAFALQQLISRAPGPTGAVVLDGTERDVEITFEA